MGVGGRLNLAPATRAQGERSAFAPDLEGQLGSRTKFDRKSKQAHDLWCVALALSLCCTLDVSHSLWACLAHLLRASTDCMYVVFLLRMHSPCTSLAFLFICWEEDPTPFHRGVIDGTF